MYNCLKLSDSVVICPYNKNHLISKSRLQRHIVKCEKNYPEHYKVMCPYNATHRLFKNEITEHVVTCPTRNVLESEMHSEPRRHGAISVSLNSEISSTVDCAENWDLERDDHLRILHDDKYSSVDSIEAHELVDSDSRDNIEKKGLRAPRGFSEAMLREANEESCVEDLESIGSSLGVGRGKNALKSGQLKLVGLGRGKPLDEF
ncbi:uncharacterized protein LOC117602012 [Osmia lignaria lignaria]|uniref:uncharacterized protein LOC117602012 n=1 Tax=Osmia lignaria lignaria TaxID=1437193 RepID=UPI0014784E0A|nr:uncharacterized protein LOC117602012 [Osmia lignaria]